MAQPRLQEAPTPEQRQQFDAFLAELGPVMPARIQINSEWDGYGWVLWAMNQREAGVAAFDALIETGYELAEKHGIDISMRPILSKYLDE